MSYPKHIVCASTVVLNDKNEILLLKGPKRGGEMFDSVVVTNCV